MIKSKFLLLAAIAITVLSSCGGNKRQLPTSNEYPVITIGAANAQMKTTYPAVLKGIQDVEIRPKALCTRRRNCSCRSGFVCY